MKKAVFTLLIILFVGVAGVSVGPARAATKKWDPAYPEGYKWVDPPLTFKFINTTDPTAKPGHPCRDWTAAEQKVARAAIQEWNRSIKCYLHNNIKEETDCTKTADITLRWEDEDFFKDWNTVPSTDPKYNKDWNLKDKAGHWYYGKEPLPKPDWGDYPPRDKFPLQEIYLNSKIPMGWYVDQTPCDDSDDFTKKRAPRPEDPLGTKYPDTWREADPENPPVDPKTGKGNPVLDYTIEWKCENCGKTGEAPKLLDKCPNCGSQKVFATGYKYSAKLDLYTLIKHEFGHALGLVHSKQKSDVMWPKLDAGEKKRKTQGDTDAFDRIYWCQCPDAKCKTERKLPRKSEVSEVLTGQKFSVTATLDIVNETDPPSSVRFWEIMPKNFTFIGGTPTPTSYNTTFAEWVFYGEDVRDRSVTYDVTAADIPGTYYFNGYQESHNVTVVTLGDYVIGVTEPPVGISFTDPEHDLIYIYTQEPVPPEEYLGYMDVTEVVVEKKQYELSCHITVNEAPPTLEYTTFYTFMFDENNDPSDNCMEYPLGDIETMYTVIYDSIIKEWKIERAIYDGYWIVEGTEAGFGMASSWPDGFSISIWIPLTELVDLGSILPWKVVTETFDGPTIGDLAPDEGLVYLNPHLGDINNDGTVDIFDVVTVAIAFGTVPGDEKWNPVADIVEDGIIDIFDVVSVAKEFGKTA